LVSGNAGIFSCEGESFSEEVVAMCYTYRDYRKEEEEARRRREELRKQREGKTKQARQKFADRERELVKV
jgi:hypothetical protein